ncbi:ATP-dependent helicase NAM7 [Blyttiomyces sp. JEL0837]|nr:ATP-dependent helicase NAM7 [Blyttiomyces sp. JEL0837]
MKIGKQEKADPPWRSNVPAQGEAISEPLKVVILEGPPGCRTASRVQPQGVKKILECVDCLARNFFDLGYFTVDLQHNGNVELVVRCLKFYISCIQYHGSPAPTNRRFAYWNGLWKPIVSISIDRMTKEYGCRHPFLKPPAPRDYDMAMKVSMPVICLIEEVWRRIANTGGGYVFRMNELNQDDLDNLRSDEDLIKVEETIKFRDYAHYRSVFDSILSTEERLYHKITASYPVPVSVTKKPSSNRSSRFLQIKFFDNLKVMDLTVGDLVKIRSVADTVKGQPDRILWESNARVVKVLETSSTIDLELDTLANARNYSDGRFELSFAPDPTPFTRRWRETELRLEIEYEFRALTSKWVAPPIIRKLALVCTPTEQSADVVAEKLGKEGLNVVRITQEGLNWRYRRNGRKCMAPVQKSINTLETLALRKSSTLTALVNKRRNDSENWREENEKQYVIQKWLAEKAVLERWADVICVSCVGAGDPRIKQLEGISFPLVVIDDAAMVSELECLIALMAPGLTPVRSMYERFLSFGWDPNCQNRMDPDVAEMYQYILSKRIWEKRTKTEKLVDEKLRHTSNCGIRVRAIFGNEEVSGDGKSYLNHKEAEYVSDHVSMLLQQGIPASEMAVITPYRGQEDHIRCIFSERYRRCPDEDLDNVEIGSIDSFIGREFAYVVISSVRTAKPGYILDKRWIYLALSRARLGMMIVGDPDMLMKNKVFLKLMKDSRSLISGEFSRDYELWCQKLAKTELEDIATEPKKNIDYHSFWQVDELEFLHHVPQGAVNMVVERIKRTPQTLLAVTFKPLAKLSDSFLDFCMEPVGTVLDGLKRPEKFWKDRRERFRMRVQKAIDCTFGECGAKVVLFGSTLNGLGARGSDVDMTIVLPAAQNLETHPCSNMILLAKNLIHIGMKDVKYILKATVPICKFYDPIYDIHADINTGNRLAIENTRLIWTYVQMDRRLEVVVHLVKYWAKQRDLNDPASGGTLSSYAFVLMVIGFFQVKGLLPSLQIMYHGVYRRLCARRTRSNRTSSEVDEEAKRLFGSLKEVRETAIREGKISPGKLLNDPPGYVPTPPGIPDSHIQFSLNSAVDKSTTWDISFEDANCKCGALQKWVSKTPKKTEEEVLKESIQLFYQLLSYYGYEYEYSNDTMISIRTGGVAKTTELLKESNKRKSQLVVEDPFELDRNVAVTLVHDTRLITEFQRAARILSESGSNGVHTPPDLVFDRLFEDQLAVLSTSLTLDEM